LLTDHDCLACRDRFWGCAASRNLVALSGLHADDRRVPGRFNLLPFLRPLLNPELGVERTNQLAGLVGHVVGGQSSD
jgi:hypothetical protein